MSTSFTDLGLPLVITDVLAKRFIHEPFPVQAATIPDVLAGRDVSGKAPTGSGKTLAFGLPIIALVGRAQSKRPRALILVPTRELAEQIHGELSEIATAMDRRITAVYGGVGYGPQKTALRRGVDVLVATPGRLEDLVKQGDLRLDDVDIAVVDEADRMADMGFLPVVRRILSQTSKSRQTLLFSATLDGDVANLRREYQKNPVTHEAASVEPRTSDARHHFWLVDPADRVRHTAEIIGSSDRTIVFTRTRHGADRLAKQLHREGVRAVAMHGGRTQSQRNSALRSFAGGMAQALIATDVAARGIHVDDVSTVVHYDLAGDHKDYIHRSGRTGRAGASGTVVSLVLPDQRKAVAQIQRHLAMKTPMVQPGLSDLGHSARTEPRRRHSSKDEPTMSIFVGNLPWSTTADDLDRLFSRHGRVSDTSVVTHRGRSKGYGFVEMPVTVASTAIRAAKGTRMSGRVLEIREARPRAAARA